MKTIKLIIAMLLLLVTGAQAQQTLTITKALTPGTNSVYGLKNRSVGLTLLSSVAGSVSFYDSNTNRITYTNALYTNYVSYATNFTALYTNTQGIIQTNYFTGQYRQAVTVPAATNNFPLLQTIYFEANVPLAYTVNWLAVNGIAAVASTNVSISLTYGPLP